MEKIKIIKKLIKKIINKYKIFILYPGFNIITSFYFNHIFNSKKRIDQKKVIVSIASWKKRLNYIYPSINSVLEQKFKPDKVILWLDFDCRGCVPNDLLSLESKGLDIRFYEDIGSYKKLLPTLKEFPNEIVVTFDDDIVYPKTILSRLYSSYMKYPNLIHSNRVKEFDLYNPNYKDFPVIRTTERKKSLNYIPIGVGGVLYPGLKCFYKDIDNIVLIMKIAPKQDDLWFWFMARLSKTEIVKIKFDIFNILDLEISATQDSALYLENIEKNKVVIDELIRFYGY